MTEKKPELIEYKERKHTNTQFFHRHCVDYLDLIKKKPRK